MKKLMIAALAVAFAAVAQAAAVAWSSGTLANGFKGPDGLTLANSSLYAMTVTFYTNDGVTEIGDLTGTTVTAAKPNGAYNTATGDSFAASTQYYVSAIITGTDANGDAWTREAALASFTMGGQGNANLNFTTGAGFDDVSMKWGEWTKVGGEAIPEPTSALMLLVGLAGLALKRKVA